MVILPSRSLVETNLFFSASTFQVKSYIGSAEDRFLDGKVWQLNKNQRGRT